METKKHYTKPLTAVTRIELESPICSGSLDITANSPNGVSVNAQEVNNDFATENTFSTSSSNGEWD